MKEILKYTLIAPYTFLSGLVLLSEMLPLPLPMQSKEVGMVSFLKEKNFLMLLQTY